MTAITATFEEKIRLMQTTAPESTPFTRPHNKPSANNKRPDNKCKLYRDPSLHRRRTNLHAPHIKHSASSDAISDLNYDSSSSQKENHQQDRNEKRFSPKTEGGEKRGGKDRRSDVERRKARIRRRHTVGGMKDMARAAWLKVIEAAHYDSKTSELPSWEHLQLIVEALARMEPKERLDAQLRRRSSVRAPNPLLERQATLESNV